MRKFNLGKAVGKLNIIMGDRFGVQVQYLSVADQSQGTARSLETVRRNSNAPLIITGTKMLVPIRVEGALVGATVVSNISRLDARSIGQIRDSIELVISGGLDTQAQLDAQTLALQHMELATNPENVLHLSDYVNRNRRIRELFGVSPEASADEMDEICGTEIMHTESTEGFHEEDEGMKIPLANPDEISSLVSTAQKQLEELGFESQFVHRIPDLIDRNKQ